jgi:hypothetical protein
MITTTDLLAVEELLHKITTPGLRRLCACCRAELPGSDPQGTRTSHGMCVPLCAEAKSMGWEEPSSPEPSSLNPS